MNVGLKFQKFRYFYEHNVTIFPLIMYYLNDDEKRDSMNANQLDMLRRAMPESESVTIKRATSVVQEQKLKEKRNKSTTYQNILLATTLIQFFIIISACTAFAFFGYSICDTKSIRSTLRGKIP